MISSEHLWEDRQKPDADDLTPVIQHRSTSAQINWAFHLNHLKISDMKRMNSKNTSVFNKEFPYP
jgi:hypothetical protein